MKIPRGFIFLCSNDTEAECLERNLFGGKEPYKRKTGNINVGDKLYLYNYSIKQLYGIFEATSESQLNIEPDAWNGDYPWQLRVKKVTDVRPISKIDFENIISFSTPYGSRFASLYPQAKLTAWQVQELEKIFNDPHRQPLEEVDFRKDFPAELLTMDGHKVRSVAEVEIDDWLFKHGVSHGYERKVPINETMYCDFFIPISDTDSGIYVEFWGLEENENYLKRKEYKQNLYDKYGFKLINLYPKDIKNLDKVLPEKIPFVKIHHE